MVKKKNSKKAKKDHSNAKSFSPIFPGVMVSRPDGVGSARSRMDALMNRFWEMDPFSYSPSFSRPFERRSMLPSARMLQPLSDYWENEKEVGISIELPGIEKKDIQLNVTDNRIEIRAEKKNESTQKKKGLFHEERSYAGFYRSFPLPKNVNESNAVAKFENGVLTLHIPKDLSFKPSSKKIEIK
jgi:HSP20 family protein